MSVKVYSTPSCSWCTVIKKYFYERGIKFKDINVASDERKYQEMVHKSRQNGVPVCEIDGKIVVGFNKQKIDKLIKNSKKRITHEKTTKN